MTMNLWPSLRSTTVPRASPESRGQQVALEPRSGLLTPGSAFFAPGAGEHKEEEKLAPGEGAPQKMRGESRRTYRGDGGEIN